MSILKISALGGVQGETGWPLTARTAVQQRQTARKDQGFVWNVSLGPSAAHQRTAGRQPVLSDGSWPHTSSRFLR
jgi:hypothetical protein